MDHTGGTAEHRWWRNPLFLFLLFCAIALVIAIAVAIRPTNNQQPDAPSANNTYSRDKTTLIVSSSHFKSPDYNEVYRHTSSIEELNEYLKTLDPYSKFLRSEEATFIEIRNRKERVGIGLNLLVGEDKILGVPVQDGPAYRAGMTLPAYIHSIDDHQIVYNDLNSYAFLTELNPGAVVRVKLENSQNQQTNSYTIEVASYINEPIIYSTDNGTLFIQIRKFSGGENSRLKKILESSKTYSKLVLDLRHCPGGDLYAMVDMLSFLLEPNLVVASLEKADGQEELSLKTLPDRIVSDMPLYVLVSEFTSSTAELFVWALKTHYPEATVLGEPTQGKCLAQDMIQLDNGSTLKLTTHNVRNAANQSCQGKPLVPNKLIRGIARSSTEEIFDKL
jgi:carboxyl-terminal processing protease